MAGYYQTAINRVFNLVFSSPDNISSTSSTWTNADTYIRYTGSANGTMILPTAIGYTGQLLFVKNTTAYTYTLTPQTGQTIDGASNLVIGAYSSCTLISVLVSGSAGGCNWETLA